MSDNKFTPYAIVPNKKYSQEDIKNDFGYKGKPDLPIEPVTALEDALTNTIGFKPFKIGVPR